MLTNNIYTFGNSGAWLLFAIIRRPTLLAMTLGSALGEAQLPICLVLNFRLGTMGPYQKNRAIFKHTADGNTSQYLKLGCGRLVQHYNAYPNLTKESLPYSFRSEQK